MATNSIVNTVTAFRENVISRGGPQIAAMYEVTMYSGTQSKTIADPLVCYPIAITIPGRQFQFFEHDIWGPSRKVPVKRTYTQCTMSFVVYQDWLERTYIEDWMNRILSTKTYTGNANLFSSPGTNNISSSQENQQNVAISLINSLSNNSVSRDAVFGEYGDYINYSNATGVISIKALNSGDKSVNKEIQLHEVYPSTISPMAMSSDGTGYAAFNVGFQFNNYIYI
jgi:hypothetical protein